MYRHLVKVSIPMVIETNMSIDELDSELIKKYFIPQMPNDYWLKQIRTGKCGAAVIKTEKMSKERSSCETV